MADEASVSETAYAKLNLTLEVLRKRSDGYHEVASIMQTIGIKDSVTVQESDALELTCTDASLANSDNLAWRAAVKLADATGRAPHVVIHIDKRIPVAAGLGGGSADAAATLRGLNRLWSLGMSNGELMQIGAEIGSDVPFLIDGGTALATGRGTEIERLPAARLGRIVVAVPMSDDGGAGQSGDKTGTMYGYLRDQLFTNGSLTRRLSARVKQGGDCHPGFMFNVFQRMAPSVFPNWDRVYAAFAQLGARDIFLTGSGPAIYAFAPNRETGTLWSELLKRRVGCAAFATDAIESVVSD